jgi:radical SAM-linked protein
MHEIICRFSKGSEVRWVSHLETMRVIERALRRANIMICYTEGFNPRPRLAMGPALPAGVTSEAEMLALFLAAKYDPEDLKERLNEQLPTAFRILTTWAVPPYGKKQTLGDIDTTEYLVTVQGPADAEELQRRAVGLLSLGEIPYTRHREKKTQQIDLRALILNLAVGEAQTGTQVKMTLRTGSGGGARPQEVLELLGIAGEAWTTSCHRLGLYAGQKENNNQQKSPRLRGLLNRQAQQRRNNRPRDAQR